MALIDKTSIGTGNTIQAEHITRIIDALNESGSYEIIATGSFTGSFTGDGSGLTGVTSAVTASHALYAVSASYEINYETSSSYSDFAKTASYVKTAQTASYINVSNIAGEIIATTASYVTTAQTASYINATNIDGTVALSTSASYALTSSYIELAQTASYVTTSQTASYVAGADVDGTVALATTASYATTSRQLTGTRRTVYTFTTTDATPHVEFFLVGPPPYGRYIKAIVIGNASGGGGSLGGEFTKFYDSSFGSGTTQLSSTGTLSENMTGIPAFSISDIDRFTATGIAGISIDWQVILEYSDI